MPVNGRKAKPTPAPSRGEETRRWWHAAPFVALMLVAALYNGTGMVQAVDLWSGLAAGRHIAAHGVDCREPFTFNGTGAATAAGTVSPAGTPAAPSGWRPHGWINQKWLTHFFLFEVHRHLGGAGIVAFRFLAYGLLAGLLFAAARVHGASTAAAAVAVAAVMAVTRPFADFRGQELTLVSVGVLLLILAIAIRRHHRVLWCAVPLMALWCNLHGGFIFGFVALGAYVAAAVLHGRSRWCALGRSGAGSAAMVTVAAAVASVLASPFRLANLTHVLEITLGRDASDWRRVNEWSPVSASGALAGEIIPLLSIVGLAALAWVVALRWRSEPRGRRDAARVTSSSAVTSDAGGVVLALFTVAMAMRSIRFVPVAAVAVAPVLAWSIHAFLTRARAATPSPGTWVRVATVARLGVAAATIAVAVTLAVRWHRAYHDPWPFTTRAVSLLDRMTFAHRRGAPLEEFVRRSGVVGRAFNFWEEGGSLAWLQEPESSQGALPVRLFIDGRAQEAFPAEILPEYLELAVGGPAGLAAATEGRAPTPSELRAMGEWVDRRLKSQEIWLAFIPTERGNEGVARALFARSNWRLVFTDEFQTVLADTDSFEGMALDGAVERGDLAPADEAARLMTIAARSALSRDASVLRRGFDAAGKAWNRHPSAAAMGLVLRFASAGLHDDVRAFAKGVVAEYRGHEARLRRSPGFVALTGGISGAARFLADDARRRGATLEAGSFAELADLVTASRVRAMRAASWWG